MNPLSQSLKAILLELSIQLTNLQSDFNSNQKTSMDFQCSNFCQINDNVVTVKTDVTRTTTVSDMRFFSIISQGMK